MSSLGHGLVPGSYHPCTPYSDSSSVSFSRTLGPPRNLEEIQSWTPVPLMRRQVGVERKMNKVFPPRIQVFVSVLETDEDGNEGV